MRKHPTSSSYSFFFILFYYIYYTYSNSIIINSISITSNIYPYSIYCKDNMLYYIVQYTIQRIHLHYYWHYPIRLHLLLQIHYHE